MAGDLRAEYGNGNVELIPVADDGSYIDVEDENSLRQYRVTAQNVAPNSELRFEFGVDSNGEEYSFTKSQNVLEIELSVVKVK